MFFFLFFGKFVVNFKQHGVNRALSVRGKLFSPKFYLANSQSVAVVKTLH